MEKVIVYIDMESLFDLRQGFLTTKGFTYLEVFNYLISDEYNSRVTDDLMGFTKDDYREEINKGNMSLVEGSVVTYLLGEVRERIVNLSSNNGMEGTNFQVEVWLNEGTFSFEGEIVDTIKNLLFISLGECCFVDIVNIPIKQLSPSFIEENNIRLLYMYSPTEWVDLHGNTLAKHPLMDTEFRVAPLYEVNDPNALKVIKELGFKDGFGYYEYFLNHYTKFRFEPGFFYSSYPVAKEIQREMMEVLKTRVVEDGKKYDSEIEELLDGQLSE